MYVHVYIYIVISLHVMHALVINDVHLYRFAYVCSTSNDVHLYIKKKHSLKKVYMYIQSD